METPEAKTGKREKGISIEACVEKANAYIREYGICLFVLDVKGSKTISQQMDLWAMLHNLTAELNNMFEAYLPDNSLAASSRIDKGFGQILGDGILAGITSSDVIQATAEYIEQYYSELLFHYNVAVDGYDTDGIRTIR